MAFQQNDGFQRKMYQGNWQCSQCQTPITELPFEPDPSRLNQLLCRDCHRQKRASFGDRRRQPNTKNPPRADFLYEANPHTKEFWCGGGQALQLANYPLENFIKDNQKYDERRK